MTTEARESLEDIKGSELFFALVYPVGTDSDAVVDALTTALGDVNYTAKEVHLILTIGEAEDSDLYNQYSDRMDRGNRFCEEYGRPDAFAYQAASKIIEDRDASFPEGTPLLAKVSTRTAYIIRSLKRPEEVQKLRDIYGNALVVIAAHSPRQARSDRLTWDIARSGTATSTPNARRPDAEDLIARDEREAGLTFGQKVSDTFPLADVFVDASHPDRLQAALSRFIEILFGYPFHTPTRMEYGMFHAQGAALLSSDLSRQVGAALATHDGQILALGTNEVPKGGGGPYWEDGPEVDRRDFTYGYDVSTDMKERAFRQLLERLADAERLQGSVDDVMQQVWPTVAGTDLMNVGEFGRGVHAEMAAIVDAATRGVPVNNTDLYTTTFPCHVCARHIVDAGIRRVIYNEPYPKSLAQFLHLDSIAIDDATEIPGRTNFVPFVGVAPRLYERLFRMESKAWRKDKGEVVQWRKFDATPRLEGVPVLYIRQEVRAVETLASLAASAASIEVESVASPASTPASIRQDEIPPDEDAGG